MLRKISFFSLAFLCAHQITAETGLILNEKEINGSIPVWNPPRNRSPLVRSAMSIDLRRNAAGKSLFPEPGDQGQMGACTAFATAYHLKSYMETLEQGWEPKGANRIFSPAFVYNQINGGRDQGSSIYEALELLRTKGCATLQLSPYRVGDYLTQPSQSALREAAKFRINSFSALTSLDAIKSALQEGHPVVAAIVTDPVFMSGQFDVYGTGKFQRQYGGSCSSQMHGRHAVVFVGYDDKRRALLLLNSWGTTWGDRGYGWMSYDLMNTVAHHNNCRNFLELAYMAINEKNKINGSKYEAEIRGNYLYLGLSPDGKPLWSWKLSLTGALDNIASVQWTIDPSLQRDAQGDKYTTAGTANEPGKKKARADIVFTDGKTLTKEYTMSFQASDRRSLSIKMQDEYIGRYQGKRNYRWNVSIDGALQDVNDLARVTYHLQGFAQNDVPVQNSAEAFAYRYNAFSPFLLKATLEFNDGSTLVIQKQMKTTAKTDDTLRVKNKAFFTGNYSNEGYPLFNWTVFVTGPAGKIDLIREIRYHLHPTFQNNLIVLTPENSSAQRGFPYSATGWGTFEISAEVYYTDGSSETLKHNLVFPALRR
ncbi:MAG: hypothetical protein KF713_17940 [Turneriella sp.]|nr:hypothetical protein [Turneriella sp.]